VNYVKLLLLALSLATLGGCATSAQKESRFVIVNRIAAVLPSDENERSVWLSIHVDTLEKQFQSQTTRWWKTNFEVFSRALVEDARSSRLDYASLSNVLKRVLADTDGNYLAYIPVAAHATTLNGEPVWIVVVHWEHWFGSQDPNGVSALSHVRTFAFTTNDLKLVGYVSCR